MAKRPGKRKVRIDSAKQTKSTEKNKSTKVTRVKIEAANCFAQGKPFLSDIDVKSGMKQAFSVPSAVNRLIRDGILSARTRASTIGPTPRKCAVSISLKKPAMRLATVHKLILVTLLKKLKTKPFCSNQYRGTPTILFFFKHREIKK